MVLLSCGSLHIEKRKHLKGFHVSWSKRSLNTKSEPILKDSLTNQESFVKSNFSQTNDFAMNSGSTFMDATIPTEEEPKQNWTKSSQRGKSKVHINSSEKTLSVDALHISSGKNFEDIQKSRSRKKNVAGYWYLLSVLLLPMFMFNKSLFFTLSFWASNNKVNGQWMLGVTTVLAFASSYLLGRTLTYDMPQIAAETSTLLATSGAGIFILNGRRRFHSRLIGSSMIALGSGYGFFSLGVSRGVLVDDPMINHPAAVVGLTILLVAVLILAVMGIAAISCNLACSGYGVAAVVLLVGGTYLMLFLFMLAILVVYRRVSQRDERFAGKAALIALAILISLAVILALGGVII